MPVASAFRWTERVRLKPDATYYAEVENRRGSIVLLPCRQQALAVQPGAVQIHAVYTARVSDVLERVGAEHDKVGPLARFERAGVAQAKQLRRPRGRRDQCVGGSESQLDEHVHLVMLG